MQLYNTIQAVKNDGKKSVFSVTLESIPFHFQWEPGVISTIKYGNYMEMKNAKNPKDKFFIVKTVIDFGKEFFGLEKINAPITKLKKADRLNIQANEEYKNTYKKLFNINV